MKNEKKLLLITGVVLIILSVLYIGSASIPNTAISATLFPLSIIAFIIGLAFVLWGLGWIILERTKVLK